MEFKAYEKALKKQTNVFFKTHRAFCEKVLELKPGQRAVVINGKVSNRLVADMHSIDNAIVRKIIHHFKAILGMERWIATNMKAFPQDISESNISCCFNTSL